MLAYSSLCHFPGIVQPFHITSLMALPIVPPSPATSIPRRSSRTQPQTVTPPFLVMYPACGDAPLSLTKDVVKGWSVYNDAPIVKGAFVLEYAGRLLTNEESRIADASYSDMEEDPGSYMFWFQYNNGMYCIDATLPSEPPPLDPDLRWGLGRYLNHSRTPNLYVALKSGNTADHRAPMTHASTTPRLCFFAKYNIPVGHELTFNYGDRSRESRRNFAWL